MSGKGKSISNEQLLQIVLDSLPFRVFWKDKDSVFMGANLGFLEDINVPSLDEVIGKDDEAFCNVSEQVERYIAEDKEVLFDGVKKLDIEEVRSLGNERLQWISTNKVPLYDHDGEIIGVLGTYQDVTPKVRYREKIESEALIDSLTGIANRRKLLSTLHQYDGDSAGLLFIDLDYFKVINDSMGHVVGDSVLKLVAQRIHGAITMEGALLVRLGGDEFSIFVPLTTNQNHQLTLEQIADKIIHAFDQPFEIEHNRFQLSVSIGVTIMKGANIDYSESFREADTAMYTAKENGRNGFQFFSEEMKQRSERKHLLNLHLRQAIEKKELSLVYQAQVDENKNLIGAEALLRWNNSVLGSVSPEEFIGIAEETGLIHKIGKWVIEQALDDLRLLSNTPMWNDDFILALNVSTKQFQNQSLAEEIDQAIRQRNLNHRNIQIEITESLLMDKNNQPIQTMLKFQKLGISIAIDDFGTGYSSLSYIANLPIDKLKIDRSFVEELHTRVTNRKLVETLVNMAKNLDMEVIAEGVEQEDEQQTLAFLGCHQYQGFYFSRPISINQFIKAYF